MPFTAKLRRATWIGIGLTVLSTLLIEGLPLVADRLRIIFFPLVPPGLNQYMLNYLHWLAQMPLLGYSESALLVSSGILLLLTRCLRRGSIEQQWLAGLQVAGGLMNLLVILLPLLIIVVNLTGWLLIALCIVLVLLVSIRGFALWTRRRAEK